MKSCTRQRSPNYWRARAVGLGALCLFVAFGFIGAESRPPDSPLLATQMPGSLLSRPAAGPRFMAGRPEVDSNTIALYHFDDQNGANVPDATGNPDGVVYGQSNITSAVYGNGFRFDGSTYIRPGNPSGLSQQGTIEAYVDFAEYCRDRGSIPFTIASIGGEYGSGQVVARLGADTWLYFRILGPDGYWYRASSAINVCRYLISGLTNPSNGQQYWWPYETWRFHHVAGTWGPNGVEIWVDGVLHGFGFRDSEPMDMTYNPYACNPQMQLGIVDPIDKWNYPPNPYYPDCSTVRRGLPLPPTDYTGGLLPYTTVLIGCDPNASRACYYGRIDEVRISNVQRSFDTMVDPTSTPPPTQTPVQTGVYNVDAHTLSLYHFDSVNPTSAYDSATGQYSIVPNGAVIVPGRYDNALEFNGRNCLRLPTWNPLNGTIEAWINLDSGNPPLDIFSVQEYSISSNPSVYLGTLPTLSGGNLVFAIASNDVRYIANSGVDPASLTGVWHHVAGTWGSRGMEVWLDGQLRGTARFYGRFPQPMSDSLAGCGAGNVFMRGLIDELRISDVQRTFAPYRQSPTSTPSVTPSVYWRDLPYLGR